MHAPAPKLDKNSIDGGVHTSLRHDSGHKHVSGEAVYVDDIPEPPADGKWTSDVTFNEPGTYVLRAVASDGSLFSYENVTVTVTP